MNITWTDRTDGRQFWQWDGKLEEWIKTVFVSWGDPKKSRG